MTSASPLGWAETALGHRFADASILQAALTHPSGKARGGETSYERLEFLGDRVLGLVIAERLYVDFDEPEGVMNRRLSSLVDKASCAAVAAALNVSEHVRLEQAARMAGVHRSENLLGDVCEALIGALYLDGGFEAAERFILHNWRKRLRGNEPPPRNPKNALQEWAQGRGLPIPVYTLIGRTGPHHAPRFCIEVSVRGQQTERAEGDSKQEAEKVAAAQMLERIM